MMNSGEILFQCPRCGGADQLRVGQSIIHSQLRWYESLDCKFCGSRSEADGVGFLPNLLREKILSVAGVWQLSLNGVKSLPSTARVLKENLYIDYKDALSLLRNGGVIYKGTKTEVLWLSEKLEGLNDNPSISLVR